MMKRCKFFADPMLACIASVLIVSCIGLFALFLWVLVYHVLPGKVDRGLGIALCAFMMLDTVVCSFILVRQGYIRYIFTEKEILFRGPLRKPTTKQYSQFFYIKRGRYYHRGIWWEFIVFTNKYLSPEELNQINNVACGENLIKIKYSDRTYQKLCEILPPRSRAALRCLFPGEMILHFLWPFFGLWEPDFGRWREQIT